LRVVECKAVFTLRRGSVWSSRQDQWSSKHVHSWSTQRRTSLDGACSQAEQSAGGQDLGVSIQCCKFEMKVVIYLNYELIGSTNLRFMRRSTDRRDRCIGNSGAITFKFWGTIKSRFSKILCENRLDTVSTKSCEISKGIPQENAGWRFWQRIVIVYFQRRQ